MRVSNALHSPICYARSKWAQAGFSMLEILVALAIMSVVATLVTVSSISMVESMRERTELKNLVNDIEMYRYVALTRDKQIVVGSDAAQNAAQLGLLPDWQVSATPAIAFSRHGTCTTGAVKLISPRGRTYDYLLVPQGCELQRSDLSG